MKVDARSIPGFLRNPGAARVVLLHGGDEGMVRFRADALATAVAGSRDDPFRVAWLARDEHGALPDEARAIGLVPGRRVVRMREVGDAQAASVDAALRAPGDSLVLLEAGELPGRSKLRALLEPHAAAAVIACYAEEGAALRTAIDQALEQAGVVAERDAKALLLERLGGDRAGTRSELDKLILFAGATKQLTAADVEDCIGDQSTVSLEDAVSACMAGDLPGMDRALEKALAEGAAPVAICRAMHGQAARMLAARAGMERGLSAEAAVGALRPPVFFKRMAGFRDSLAAWPIDRLRTAAARIQTTEAACKQTGARDALLVRRLLFGLCRQAAMIRGRVPA